MTLETLMMSGFPTEDPPVRASAKAPHLADRNYRLSPLNAGYGVANKKITGRQRFGTGKVLIYGAGIYKEEAEPYLNDPSWEVWAINLVPPLDRAGNLRADIWFDLHQRHAQTSDDMRWIQHCPFPIYVPPDLEEGTPNAVRFPLAEIEAEFGEYWACTFAYQIALAMHEAATDLALFGVELMYGTDRERTVEWACTSYWLGRAEGYGINLHLPTHSLLGRHCARYGFEYDDEVQKVKEYTESMAEDVDWRRQNKGGVDVGG